MAQLFIVVNEHQPEECDAMEDGFDRVPTHMKGQRFYCTCPYGVHGYYMVLEGDTAEEVILGLPKSLRPGTRALPVDVWEM